MFILHRYSKYHRIQLYASVFLLFLAQLLLVGCSDDSHRGKWVESKEGIKIFVPLDFSEKYNESSLRCVSENTIEEVDFPIGPFKILVQTKGDKPKKIERTEVYPTLIPLDSLIYNTGEGTFSIVLGDVKNKKTEGYAWEVLCTKDSIPYRYEIGYFDKNNLSRGYRLSLDYEDNTKTHKIGTFKSGKLYCGIKQNIFNDSIGEKIIGVWDRNGKANKVYENLARQHHNICVSKGYDADQIENANIVFAHRYFFWLKYKWYFFIGLSLIGICFVLIPMGSVRPEDNDEAHQWDIDNYRIKPWTCSGAFIRWLIFGLFRVDLYYLRNFGLCSFMNLALWVTIVGSSKFIVLYSLEPSMWINLAPVIINYWQGWIFIICVLSWLIGLITIPYKVYKMNFTEFRHNIYEDLILKNHKKDYESLYYEIPKAVKEDGPVICSISTVAKDEYNKKQGAISKAFSFITGSKVRHARNKAETLLDLAKSISGIANKHSKLLNRLTVFLDIERKNAYRNMILAKELVSFIRKYKSNQMGLMQDSIGNINIQSPDDTVELDYSTLPEVDLQDSFIKGFNSFDSTFTFLKDNGFEDKESMLVGLGIGVLESMIDGVAQIDSLRTAECEHYEYLSSTIIRDIQNTEAKLISIHGKMLRANEIIQALTMANEAFVKAYTPLRDQIFGTSPTLSGFVDYYSNRHKDRAARLKDDIAYLISVCSEYNKINMSKL